MSSIILEGNASENIANARGNQFEHQFSRQLRPKNIACAIWRQFQYQFSRHAYAFEFLPMLNPKGGSLRISLIGNDVRISNIASANGCQFEHRFSRQFRSNP